MSSQDEMAGSTVSRPNWAGFDRLRLQDDATSVEVTVGSIDRWDRAHLRRLRQSADLPGLVPIIDTDFASDGKPYAVTPVVDSQTLSDRLSDSEWSDTAAVIESAARATHEAHLRGLFHGGLSPDQVHILDDSVAVSGIGLGLGGTPDSESSQWVAPEVLEGGDATERSDVYSLGRMLDDALGDSIKEVPSIRRLVTWSCSDTPEARPPSAQEFASILAEALGDDRTTYSPAFIPTAESTDLASSASEIVAGHTVSETSRVSGAGAAVAGGAAAMAGGAAAAASSIGGDDDDIDSDGLEVIENGIEDEAAVTGELDDIQDEAAVTGELDDIDTDDVSMDIEDQAAVTGELDDIEGEAAVTGDVMETEAAVTGEFDEPRADEADSLIARRTFDEEGGRNNRAGMLIGALLALGLAVIAFAALRSGGNDDETTTDTEVASPNTSEAADEAATDTDATEPEVTTTVTTEPPTTEAAPTTEAEAEVEEEEPLEVELASDGDPIPLLEGPIAADDAAIQIVHGVPDTDVDVYVDGRALAAGFSAGTIAGPIALDPGSYDVAIYAADAEAPADAANRGDDPVISQTVVVGDLPSTLVAHLDADGNPALAGFVEEFDDLDPGTGRLVLRHVAAAPAVTATVDGDAIDGSLSSGQSVALAVPAGDHQVEVLTEDGTPVTTAGLNLDDGEVVSVSVIGSAENETIGLIVQRYTGLASAPVEVPTGNSNLLGQGDDPTGLIIVGLLAVMMAGAGGMLMLRRSRQTL